VITGAQTGLVTPNALALDATGRLYVANQAAQTITVYAPGAQGDATPTATIAGANTGLSSPDGVTIDPSGDLWVSDDGTNSLTEYAPGATGNVAPLRTITGAATGLASPEGLTIDAAGNVLVANPFGETLTEYAPTASGNAAPLRTITGPGLIYPTGVDVDTQGTIYVADEFANTIFTFAATDDGDSVPLATITGPPTGLDAPTLLALTPPLSVLTTALPPGRRDHLYFVALRAGLGTTPYRWTLTGGRLPWGLRLDSAGRIQGRPRHAGRYPLTVTVTDSSHPTLTANQNLTLVIYRHRRQRW
jgi:sugar lactone lactonase YvrE